MVRRSEIHADDDAGADVIHSDPGGVSVLARPLVKAAGVSAGGPGELDARGQYALKYRPHGPGLLVFVSSRPVVRIHFRRLGHISPAGQLHLHGVHAFDRPSMVTGGVAALEPAVGDPGELRFRAELFDPRRKGWGAAGATVGADVEVGQLALEQPRYAR